MFETAVDLIHALPNEEGTKAKTELIRRHQRDPGVQALLHAALHPLITYGIKALPQVSNDGEQPLQKASMTLLARLADRTLTGGRAHLAVQTHLSALRPTHQDVFRRVLLKDLRLGIGVTVVNKAIPGLIPVFSCMLAQPFEEKRIKSWPVMVQPKLDGMRILAVVDRNTNAVGFFSRNGNPVTTLDSLADGVLAAAHASTVEGIEVVFDGEILSGTFLNTVSQVRRKNEDAADAVFHVFDVLPGWVFRGEEQDGYADAMGRLESHVKPLGSLGSNRVIPIESHLCHSYEEIYAHYQRIRDAGGEGVIVKVVGSRYEPKRSYSWMKIKAKETADIRVIGLEEGTGKNAGSTGAILAEYKGKEVAVSGLSDALRAELWAVHQEDPAVLIGRIIEVEYHEETEYGSLRHPRFLRFRDSQTGQKE